MFMIGIEPSAALSSADLTQGGRGAAVGDETADHLGNRLRFVQASGTVAQFDVVAITSAGVAQALTSALGTAGGFIGVAQAALSSGEFGWAMVQGITSVQVLSTCSAGVALYTSGTAGKLDDTSASQVKIAGIQLVANQTASGTGLALLTTRPFVAL